MSRPHPEAEIRTSKKSHKNYWCLPNGEFLYFVDEVPEETWKIVKINKRIYEWDVNGGKTKWEEERKALSTLKFYE